MENAIGHALPRDRMDKVEFVVVIPQEGCGGCITYAESFYEEYKDNPRVLFVFTGIVSEKRLRKRVRLNRNAYLDKEGLFLRGCRASERLYPAAVFLKEGKVLRIKRQSPQEDGLIELEDILDGETTGF